MFYSYKTARGEGGRKPPARVRDLPLAGSTSWFPGKSSRLPGGRLQGMVLVVLGGGCTLVELEVAGKVLPYYQGSSMRPHCLTIELFLSMKNLVKFHLVVFSKILLPLGWTLIHFHSRWSLSPFSQTLHIQSLMLYPAANS